MATYYWLLPSVTTARLGEELILLLGTTFLRFKDGAEEVLGLAHRLDGNLEEGEVDALHGMRALLELVDAEGWLVRLERPLRELLASAPRKTRQLSYYAHLQRQYPDRAFAQLGAARVAIVGVGGVGSHVAQSLAGAGVPKLVLIDPDTVDESNLNRQFFYTRDDLGAPKAERAAAFLKQRFPELEVTTAIAAWTDETPRLELMQGIDLIVFAGDSPTVNRSAAEGIGLTPFVCGGYMGARGIVGPLVWPSRTGSCWKCTLESMNDQSIMEAICRGTVERATAWNPSGAQVNGIVGNLLSEVAVRALAPALGVGLRANERITIDMATLAITRDGFEAKPCPHVTTEVRA